MRQIVKMNRNDAESKNATGSCQIDCRDFLLFGAFACKIGVSINETEVNKMTLAEKIINLRKQKGWAQE